MATEAPEQPQQRPTRLGGGHPYPDIFDPAAPYPFYKLHPLFESGSLIDAKGKTVEWKELHGKSVALYFGDFTKPKCKSFLPVLVNAYRTFNESGDAQKVEVVFVSLDLTEEDYEIHRARMPWLSLKYGDPLINVFKQHFRVMHPTELPKFGYGQRIGPPALLVIASDGRLLQQLNPAEDGVQIIRKWDIISLRF